MSDDRIDELASILISAREDVRALEPLPDELIPADAAEANRVDDRVAELTAWPVLGWKIGCTSEHAQALLGSDGPFAGRVYSLFETGTELGSSELAVDPHLEGEFAFTMAHDLEPTGGPIDPADVLAAVGSVRPAIEMVGGRFADFFGTPLNLLIADAGANTLLVVGDGMDEVDPNELVATQATMSVDGQQTGAGSGADVLGGPFDALCWLADHLSGRGIGLHAGQVVTTGTATQVSPLPIGATAVAELSGVGSVSVSRQP